MHDSLRLAIVNQPSLDAVLGFSVRALYLVMFNIRTKARRLQCRETRLDSPVAVRNRSQQAVGSGCEVL